MHTKFWSHNLKGRDYMEGTRKKGDNIVKEVKELSVGVWSGFIRPHDRGQWRALVNIAIFRFHKCRGFFKWVSGY
jgi:hypothetical protein